MKRTRPSPLGRIHWIVNLDETAISEKALLAHAERLLDTGLPSLQLRAKSWPTARIVEGGGALRALARERGARFLVNGDPEAAALLGADGVHLPARGRSAAAARAILGPAALLGRSAHDEDELAAAIDVDWVLLAPVFATRSKPGAPPMGLARFVELAARSPAPAIALGGVDRTNAESCFAAGAAGVAAVSALLGKDAADFVRETLQV
jgi:thiamine-phosphate diphosphorylase